jgi:hypothetical protein
LEKPLRYKPEEEMSQSKAEAIVAQLLTNAAGLRYGAVSVSAKLHDGRVVELSYSRIEHTRDLDNEKDNAYL